MSDQFGAKEQPLKLSTSSAEEITLAQPQRPTAKGPGSPAVEPEQHLSAETLAEVTLALTSQSSLAVVLKEILRQAQRLVPYRTAHIMLLKEDNLYIAAWHGYQAFGNEELMSNLIQPLADFPLDARVVQSRQPWLVPDTRQEPLWTVQDGANWVRSNLMLPICLGNEVLGLLRLDADTPSAFSPHDNVILKSPWLCRTNENLRREIRPSLVNQFRGRVIPYHGSVQGF